MNLSPRIPAAIATAFRHGTALKIISGLGQFDPQRVAAVVTAAHHGGATYVDIAADPALVQLVATLTQLPICVSAIAPEALVQCVSAGAAMVELGNYDSFYGTGREFSATEVLALAQQTQALLPNVPLAVTVPHTLSLSEQVDLAEALEAAGADILQTEGGTSSSPQSAGTLGLMEKATPTLAAAYELSRAVAIPVLCASGITNVTAPLAIAAGAAGVGVGSAVHRLEDPVAMVAAVRSLRESLARQTAIV
ncbi:MAG: DUF561 domain-containing protein [Oscillatoriales cyanobacterium SM2_2_1]|nr:DUF561 domain-containing protein [Oscillatoriales cyanobacterium SM2_2_1]